MPLYAYECEECQHEFEAQQSFSDDPIEVCPKCSNPSARRVITSVGIIFKGPGFYVTDSRKALTNGKHSESKETTKPEKSETKT